MGEFNSEDHYTYYCRQASIQRKSSHHSQQKSPTCSTWMKSLDRMISVCFEGKPLNITVIQVCAPTSNAEEAEVEQFYEDLQDLLELLHLQLLSLVQLFTTQWTVAHQAPPSMEFSRKNTEVCCHILL